MTARDKLMQDYTRPETVPAVVRVQVEPGRPVVRVKDALGSRLVVAEVVNEKHAPEVGG